jgi:HPt (histidine-containing phosphotransfer) domain-containing protein
MMTDVSNGEEIAEPVSLDPEALERLRRFGGAKLLGEMVRLFLDAAPARIAAAREGSDAGDATATELALHSLKSSSAQLGAMRMHRLCGQGEQLAKSGDLGIVGLLVSDLEDEFVRVREWLTGYPDGGRA